MADMPAKPAVAATQLLSHDDSSLRQFEAQVAGAERRACALERTAGGEDGEGIWHELAPAAGETLAVGQRVAGEIDWPFRYRTARPRTRAN